MKKLIILFNLFCFLFEITVNAQNKGLIIFNTPPLFIRPVTGDSSINIKFAVHNHLAKKFKIDITDGLQGSAIYKDDYDTVYTKIFEDSISGIVRLKIEAQKPCMLTDKSIILNATGVSGNDTIYGTTEVILHNQLTEHLTESLRKACKLLGIPLNKQLKSIDSSNTPKFEFVTYTDFKGYDPDQPNGIAQSQFLFKIPINRHYKQWKDGETKVQWFRSFILPDLLFNRIDKTNQPVSLQPTYNKYKDSAIVSPVVNSFDFIRYSNFIFNSKLVVLTIMRPKSRFQLQLNGSLYRIKVDSANISNNHFADSANSNSSKDTVALNPVWGTGFGAELYYDTKFTDDEFPFNFRFVLGGQIIKLRSGEYKQADVAPVTPDNLQKAALLINNNHKFSAPIWSFSATIKKNLGLKPSNANSEDHYLFFRFNYSWQFFKSNVLTSNTPVKYESRKLSNNFSQFQLGVDLNFDSFFKNK